MYENYDGQSKDNTYSYSTPEVQPPGSDKPPYDAPPKKEKKIGIGAIIAIALCCSLVGATVGVAGTMLFGNAVKENKNSSYIIEGERENTVLDVKTIDTSKVMTAAEIYAINVNSTVGITTSVTTTNFFGYKTTSAASGSGFVLTKDGYIVTNHHVIEDADSITVTSFTGKTYEATLVGYDESNDLAVIKVEADDLSPVVLGDSDNMNVGDGVVAIGNPLGELTFSLTSGAVSALDREITMSNGISMDLIQTDCAINSGNSGGALFNMYGEVIGITNAKYSSSRTSSASIDNIGFAIPINNVKSIIKSIIETGYIEKPYIGVSIEDVTSETQGYGVPKGAAVKAVTDDGPADKAGIKANDVITAADDIAIESSDDLKEYISGCESGDEVVLTVYRQGKTLKVTVTVEIQRQSALESGSNATPDQDNNNNGFGSFFDQFENFFG